MKLRYHSDFSSFYDGEKKLYPEPKETLEELETKLIVACEKLNSLPKTKPAMNILMMRIYSLTLVLQSLISVISSKILSGRLI